MANNEQFQLARLAGGLAARAGRPLTDCPYDPDSQALLTLWFIRGYRAEQGRAGGNDNASDAAGTVA